MVVLRAVGLEDLRVRLDALERQRVAHLEVAAGAAERNVRLLLTVGYRGRRIRSTNCV